MTYKSLDQVIRKLPPEAQVQVQNFAEFLLARYTRESSTELRLQWRGALSDLKPSTSVDLAHESLKWWSE